MEILDNQQQRLALGSAADELAKAVPYVAARQLRGQLDWRRDVRKDAPERRRDTGDLCSHITECLPQRQRAPRITDGLLDHLDIRQVRRGTAHFHAVPD